MGLLPNDAPWYTLVGIAIVLGIHDSYRWIRLKSSQLSQHAYDYFDDKVTSVSLILSQKVDGVLYQIGASETSHSPRKFPRFNDLPAEIRASIWHLALPGPRTIEIRHPLDQASRLVRGDRESARSICRIPSLLQVCREARGEALKVYELAFGLHYDVNDNEDDEEILKDVKGKCRPKIYVDFKRDTIYFGVRSDFYGVQSISRSNGKKSHVQGLEKIRYLALRTRSFRNVSKFDVGIFRSLEEVVLVAQDKQRRFDLGREPILDKNQMIVLVVLTDSFRRSLVRYSLELQEKMSAREDQVGGWVAPTVKLGTFVKGEGDKWYCEKPTPRWQF